MRTAVLGLGNPLFADDGAGVAALERLGPVPEEVEVLEGATDGLRLLAWLRGVRRLLVLDAVEAGQPPGTVLRLEGEALAGLPGGGGVHRLGLPDLLASLEMLGEGPEETVLLGVQPGVLETRVGLSPEVDRGVDRLVVHARGVLEAWSG